MRRRPTYGGAFSYRGELPPPITVDEWDAEIEAPTAADFQEAEDAAKRRAGAGFQAAADVRTDRYRVEAAMVSVLVQRLELLRDDLVKALVSASTDFRRFEVARLLADVDRMLETAKRDVITKARKSYEDAAKLGIEHVDSSLRATKLAVTSAPSVDPVLVSFAYENTAELLTEPMQVFRSRAAAQVRRLALTAENFGDNLLTLAGEIKSEGMAGAEFKAERILRTELSRTFNASTYARIEALAANMPFLRKIWIRTKDGRTRPTHVTAGAVYARGQGIPVGELFKVGKATMRFPVDPLAAPAGKVAARETIMCRCSAAVDYDLAELRKETENRIALGVGGTSPDLTPPPPAPVPTPKPKAPRKPKTPAGALRGADVRKKLDAVSKKYATEVALRQAAYDDSFKLRNAAQDRWFAASGESKEAAYTFYRALVDQTREARQKLDAILAERKKAAHKLIHAEKNRRPRYAIGFNATDKFTAAEKKAFTAAIREFEKFAAIAPAGSPLRGLLRNIDVKRARAADGSLVSRSYATGTFELNGRRYTQPSAINMGTLDPDVVVHEMAHTLEFEDGALLVKTRAFLAKRAGNDPLRKLSDITGNAAYRDNELAWEDKFLNPYMGKDYGPGATEIVSMGVEQLFRDPFLLAEKDPEYFEFLVDLLRGF